MRVLTILCERLSKEIIQVDKNLREPYIYEPN